jgi:subtilisin family serine protease
MRKIKRFTEWHIDASFAELCETMPFSKEIAVKPSKKSTYYDFIVLPARGLFAPDGRAHEVASVLSGLVRDGDRTKSFDEVVESLGNVWSFNVAGSQSVAYLQEKTKGKSFAMKVVSSRNDGGPMSVRASAEGERVLRAAGFRVLRQQQYRLIAPADMVSFHIDATQAGIPRRDFRSEIYLEKPSRAHSKRGEDVVVGIVDTGIDGKHPALRHAVTGGRSFIDGEDALDWGPASGAKGGHGTHVAGIVAAKDPQGRCPDGVAPMAKLRSYRVFGGANGDRVMTGGVIDAILAAVDDGCDIINLSLGGRSLKEDGMRDAINYAWDNGVICVAASGNSSRATVTYPAAHPNCVGVSALGRESLLPAGSPSLAFVAEPRAATDPDVFLASFANIGPQIDFGGPGVGIISTMPGDSFAESSGTSMAAPAVSGAAALALSDNNHILTAARDKDRAAAFFALLVSLAKPYELGSLDYEGYGVPR